ncbi:hypothetical protein AB0001_004786 [Salmonella enterica]|nr:hypothetical protein [Salmonella enterica]EEP3373022.1 hypothetical protein [Salmonella enterica]EFP6579729.1 hypothetical protein [Salmonella enterica]EGC7971012.1 hypothetical protein [Salmonella enterica]EIV4461189.1 hypothetical protein [Salmonella enterica]
MTLTNLLKAIEENSKRPLLCIQVLFFCIERQMEEGHRVIFKNEIDSFLCKEEDKMKSFSKNTSAVITDMENAGILVKYSLIGGEVSEYRGQPYPLAVSVTQEVTISFSR